MCSTRGGTGIGSAGAGAQVWVQYVDDAGHKQSYTVDGSMVFRQYPDAAGRQVADVLLVGRFAGQDVFELGSNQTEHWMAIRMDVKKAYVGALNGPGAATIPLVAEDVAQVLAIARLYEVIAPVPAAQRLAMTVQDKPEPPTNDVYVIRTPSDRPAWIERIETVNRRTGHVAEVRMFHPDGTVEAVATLSDYGPTAGEVAETLFNPGGVFLPHKVHIEYPSRQAKLELTFSTMNLAPELVGRGGTGRSRCRLLGTRVWRSLILTGRRRGVKGRRGGAAGDSEAGGVSGERAGWRVVAAGAAEPGRFGVVKREMSAGAGAAAF